MAPKFDIAPLLDPLGGTNIVATYGITVSQTFEMGEVVGLVDAGTITELPQDGTEVLISDLDSGKVVGISCFGPGASNLNPKTGTSVWAVGTNLSIWPADRGTYFITPYFFAAGGAAAAVPAITDLGESYQVVYGAGTFNGVATNRWGVEQTAGVAGTDVRAVIHRVLDANKKDIRESGQTGVYVVFELNTV